MSSFCKRSRKLCIGVCVSLTKDEYETSEESLLDQLPIDNTKQNCVTIRKKLKFVQKNTNFN